MYGEDIDLCYRIQKTGKKIYYLGTETMIHFKGEGSLSDINSLKEKVYKKLHRSSIDERSVASKA